ncbi:MAG TPA: hypothetical protein VGS10_05780 [Terracidiphilus sp.]|nr:hypothetical protein [Terracidiphilus sp.]
MKLTLRGFVAVIGMLQVLALVVAFSRPAYAYVDPGSGLLLAQIGGSMVAGVLLYLRSKIKRLLRLGSAITTKNPDERV